MGRGLVVFSASENVAGDVLHLFTAIFYAFFKRIFGLLFSPFQRLLYSFVIYELTTFLTIYT